VWAIRIWGDSGNWGLVSFKNEKSAFKSAMRWVDSIEIGKNNGSTKILARILITVDDGNPPHYPS
jgi:hypothetical protein